MEILKRVIDIINKAIPDVPPETGGIIGSSNGEIIDSVVIDHPNVSYGKVCSYSPNVEFLNNSIATWQCNAIEFKGLFHTHFAGVDTLSCADKRYITEIMNAMPETIKYLYFPVFVLPDRRIKGYRAERAGATIKITDEVVTVQD